ncbi:MAG: hypothetical protein IT209_08715 [Armatimonadetes bacterium]|nr:hypothetical protein [Armatimonadota bacterium]
MLRWFFAVWLLLASFVRMSPVYGESYDRKGLYGVGHPAGGYLLGNPADYEDTVWRRIAEAGATSVRVAASWREIEAQKGKYDWSDLEKTLKYFRKYPQLRPYILVVNTPGWARADGKPSHLPPTPAALPEWKAFNRELARKYRGFISHFEVWNEQNGFGWEVPPYNQVDKYLPVLEAAYDGLKEGNPECMVSLGGLDDAAGNSPIFTKGCYDLRLKDYGNRVMWDAFGDHPYGDVPSTMSKLRLIKGIAAGYGDGPIEMWLTEYGFNTRDMSLKEQAKQLTEYMTLLITDPEFRYVTETNYLCVADFEAGNRSFGLCDVNLRPRPAFYAYQRLPRPGQIVISDIKAEPLSANRVAIIWQTDGAATGTVELDGKPAARTSKDTRHRAVIEGLQPGSRHAFRIRCNAPGYPEAATLEYPIRALAASGLLNGGFEEGFDVGIAGGWRCIGENHCWDSARLEEKLRRAHSGKSAQAIVAHGQWNVRLDDAVAAQAAVQPGSEISFSVWTRADSEAKDTSVIRRVGIDPTGGQDPESGNVVWSEPSSEMGIWQRQTVTVQTKGSIATVFAAANSEQSGKARNVFYVDDATLRSR